MIDPEWLKIVSHELLARGRRARCSCTRWVVGAILDGDQVRGVIFESKEGRRAILAKVVVDATGDLDVCAQAGALRHDSDVEGEGSNVQHCINTAFMWAGVDFGRWLEFKRGEPQAHRAFTKRGRELLGYLETPYVGWRDDVVVFLGPRLAGYSGLKVERPERGGARVAPADGRPPRLLPPQRSRLRARVDHARRAPDGRAHDTAPGRGCTR